MGAGQMYGGGNPADGLASHPGGTGNSLSRYTDRVVDHFARMHTFFNVKLFLTVNKLLFQAASLLEIEVEFFFLLITSADLDMTVFNKSLIQQDKLKKLLYNRSDNRFEDPKERWVVNLSSKPLGD